MRFGKKIIHGLSIVSIMALGAASLRAEMPVSFGFKGGIPLTDWFNIDNSISNPTGPQYVYHSATRRYEFGPTAEFRVYHFRIEVDALYKRLGYDFNAPDPQNPGSFIYNNVKANQWEFPAVIKYPFSLGRFRPYVEVGASLRHISTIRQTTSSAELYAPMITNNTAALHNRNSYGGVAGFGVTFKVREHLEISPEVRYTRWANQAFTSNPSLLRTNLDQGDFLVGVNF
jgi:opacity protein-like surface antigen